MTGRRHRSNLELVAQGAANMASACMGGIPATGAIARTATNIRAGAATPVAGIVHALAILAMMALFAPLASYVPLAALGAVLAIVCWNMAEFDAIRNILSGPRGDRFVLIATFVLTVAVDLTFAIVVGMVTAAFLFMHRMAGVVEAETHVSLLERDVDEIAAPESGAPIRERLPEGVEMFRLSGPFFFGAAAQVEQVLSQVGRKPRVIVLDMSDVPLIDATGAETLRRFISGAASRHIGVVLAGTEAGPDRVLANMGVAAPRAPDVRTALAMVAATF
jgi:SulP family sulfate permease